MRVNVMEIGHLESSTVLLMVEEETLITVENYGTADFRWKVQNAKENANQEWIAAMLSIAGIFTEAPDGEGFYNGMNTLGTAMVWANPVTFAHVVMDLINNQ